MIHTGELSNEEEIQKMFPVLFFHYKKKIEVYLSHKYQIGFEPKPMHVRINYGDPGTGKTYGAVVNTFLILLGIFLFQFFYQVILTDKKKLSVKTFLMEGNQKEKNQNFEKTFFENNFCR